MSATPLSQDLSSVPSSSSITYLQAIPPALFFVAPLLAVVLIFVGMSRSRSHRQPRPVNIPLASYWSNERQSSRRACLLWSYLAICTLGLSAAFAGAFGLCGSSEQLVTAQAVVTSCLRFELGASVVCFLAVSLPSSAISPSKLWLCIITLSSILLSATLVSVLASVYPHTIPHLVAPLLSLFFAIITIPLLAFILLTAFRPAKASHSCHSSFSSPSRTSTILSFFPGTPNDNEKIEDLPAPPLADIHMSTRIGGHPPSSSNETNKNLVADAFDYNLASSNRLRTRRVWILLLGAQICALLAATFEIGGLVILSGGLATGNPAAIVLEVGVGAWMDAWVFNIVQTIFVVLCTSCIMAAFLLHSFSTQDSPAPNTASGTLTPLPSRIFRPFSRYHVQAPQPPQIPARPPPLRCSYYPSRASSLRRSPPAHHLADPASPPHSQLAEDFLNLRDPFASPNVGAIIKPKSSNDDLHSSVGSADWGAIPPVPLLPPSIVVTNPGGTTGVRVTGRARPATLARSLSSKYSGLGIGVGPKPKSRGRSQRGVGGTAKRGSSQALLLPVSGPLAPSPVCPFAPCVFPASRRRLGGGSVRVVERVDVGAEFDPEEAMLGQLLLKTLDSPCESRVAGVTETMYSVDSGVDLRERVDGKEGVL